MGPFGKFGRSNFILKYALITVTRDALLDTVMLMRLIILIPW